MKILIVEDDENKRSQLVDFISNLFSFIDIRTAKSFQSGLRAIINSPPDIVLLDMTMPTYDITIEEDGGRPQHYAGREILRQMDRRSLSIPTLVVTGFDHFGEGANYMSREQLHTTLKIDHPAFYRGTIYFNAATEDWKPLLENRVNAIIKDLADD